MYLDPLGVLAGIILTIIGINLIKIALNYCETIQGPGKRLAKNFVISASLFTAGSIGVIIDSLTKTPLWIIMASFYTISYLLLVSSVGFYLRALSSQEARPKQRHEKTPTLPVTGAYAFKKPASPKTLAFLSEISSGLLVVSRMRKEFWMEKYHLEPDEFIWVSRIEEKNAIDPTKLHVLQDAIVKFLREKSGKAVVYFEGVEYLILYNDFPSVAKFLFSLKDHVISNESLLILYFPPGVLDKPQKNVLLKEFEEKNEKDLIEEITQKMITTLIEGGKHGSSQGKEN
ncbi:DUF835 domain-containing protein [Thermococcus aggregans]|uniref:DUF835 domain-containing protein n=1 Tax=Thermococcus aggregans TaxID=110163 RepID=A0A9E7SNM4_THEAG|nr:DUF835 domain-containing protein [Thermococcus aggregans]USS39942.1 DUF835 domain-containing protein [Thermococcus aggregans]